MIPLTLSTLLNVARSHKQVLWAPWIEPPVDLGADELLGVREVRPPEAENIFSIADVKC